MYQMPKQSGLFVLALRNGSLLFCFFAIQSNAPQLKFASVHTCPTKFATLWAKITKNNEIKKWNSLLKQSSCAILAE